MNTDTINDNGQCLETNRRWNLDILNIKEKQRNIFLKNIQGKNYSYRRYGKKIQPMYKRHSQRRPKQWNRTNIVIYYIK